MDYSSLVAARPSVALFSSSSSRKRWAAIVGASMLFVACAALVATLGAPQRPTLAADIGYSLSERTAPADASLVRSSLYRAARFTALQEDPIDSVLKKASTLVAFVQTPLAAV